VFKDVNLHIERGDRIALVGPNGAGKSTLMRMLSQSESPDGGTMTVGHQVVMEYFAQDEAVRLNPALTVYETLQAGSPNDMVPAIRNILGGFLSRATTSTRRRASCRAASARASRWRACCCGRRIRCFSTSRPTTWIWTRRTCSSKRLEDYGGTLILVSHDRYFVGSSRRRIIEIGRRRGPGVSGTYTEFL
jgi:ATP-binding cassette subfamily F protein 3